MKHNPLLAQLRGKIGGGKLVRLIGHYLRAGVDLPDGTREATPLGVPQGVPLSPLLANILFGSIDKELTRRGYVSARYAEDFLILVKSAKAARCVMESVTTYGEVKLSWWSTAPRASSRRSPSAGSSGSKSVIRVM